ncbi:MAG: hypothetical protein OS112_01155 [Methanoregula sp.]|nr:MAG: hypothetical protein OS112_01155 [Methanoregula sp.]
MTRLDDLLAPLHQGVWEVVADKESVTEPLDAGWKWSSLNIPTPGTIASYRKGQYHVHETETEWRVHLDRYDPAAHPLMHLIDDAPLLLMIAHTCSTLIHHARSKNDENTRTILEEQQVSWQRQVLIGLSCLSVAVFILLDPLVFFSGIVHYAIPLALVGLGSGIIYSGIRSQGLVPVEGIGQGLCIFAIGVVSWYLPPFIWSTFILVTLAVWSCASAIILISRVAKGRAAVPEGFFSRLVIGILSFILAFFVMEMPAAGAFFLVEVVGVLALLGGFVLVVNGLRLREWMVNR